MTVATQPVPPGIRSFQLWAAKQAVRLEMNGLRHSSGRSMRMRWARHFNMPGRPSYLAVIERIEAELATIHAQIHQEGDQS